ncbi:MAG: heme exporter protein CcmB [Candidatus Dactylopiibacterium carminicum]|uniref:Heme exporter protein B n=1 Tax=Candidatus Dactylopiibacterium carminicum TaxID=857335 RepID=A0A272EXN9_9RHOO|nr:heme exporter protein CcmB [Candidatus Dactylopiibacterium carminicum]KAF7600175.1 heme exporter protein CcmB [Candidatus Dactylopiibacterium carminicum]PAS94806.1 MAG: heme exporter protein CcmB [Candidatus Dactylopiibacterium carminicum]PAS97730.1 MAG: heme exporter protein CcmB [Candidatus Dactylopiibacterium carminicum]PAT00177.1 MAG: heme exporter protein CcmB [Candidatus Dactylopiibacterium carminicum]
MNLFFAVLRRDLLLAWRTRAELGVALAFFVIVASLFPFAIGAETARLQAVGAGVVWVAALLAGLLALPRLFAADHDSGVLEQLLLSPEPPVLWVTAKILAHWLATGLPLVLLSPLLAMMYQLSAESGGVLMLALLLGTPVFSLLGAVCAALTLGLHGAGALLALLLLPLCVPVLVFGAGAVSAWSAGVGLAAHLSLLGGGLLAAIALAPWACAAALRLGVD